MPIPEVDRHFGQHDSIGGKAVAAENHQPSRGVCGKTLGNDMAALFDNRIQVANGLSQCRVPQRPPDQVAGDRNSGTQKLARDRPLPQITQALPYLIDCHDLLPGCAQRTAELRISL